MTEEIIQRNYRVLRQRFDYEGEAVWCCYTNDRVEAVYAYKHDAQMWLERSLRIQNAAKAIHNLKQRSAK